MKDISDLHFRVIDKGIFLPIALRLARDAGRVSYWSPHEKAFPTIKDCIGDGFDEIERVDSPWKDKESVDCWAFPDIGFPELQAELISQGFPVWGPNGGCELEVYRGKFLKALEQTDLPMPPHEVIKGMTALREHLSDKEDKWIKISRFRGDWETMHWIDRGVSELELDIRAVKLGPVKELMTFYAFDDIPTELEDGYDGYCIDGQWPALCVHGMEAKDKAFLGAVTRFDELAPELKCVNDAFGPILAKYNYRGFFSSEVRITKELESYFIDPTLRAGSPPSQMMTELFGNYSEIIWSGAHGALVSPEPVAKYGVQALVCVNADRRQGWTAMEVPADLEQWVKCGFCLKVGSRLCFPPDQDCPKNDVGWLVGIGDTIESAIAHLRENVDKLPCEASCDFSALADLLVEAKTAEKAGIDLAEQPVPDPEIIVQETS